MFNYDSNLGHLKEIDNLKFPDRYKEGEDFKEWQKKAKAIMSDLLGMDKFEKCNPEFCLEYTKEFDNHTDLRFTFKSEENVYIPCHLLIPKVKKDKYPLMICLQGHSKGMHISVGQPKFESDYNSIEGDRDFAIQAIERGYMALAIEQRAFGELSSREDSRPSCPVPTMAALLLGRTMIGERLWDIMRALDVVIDNYGDMIDMDKIGAKGNSGGGTSVYYLGCFEDRISLLMPSCYVNTFRGSIASIHHCICNIIPGILEHFEMGDVAGIYADKTLIVVAGERDPIFPIQYTKESFEQIKKLYTAAGNPDGCALVVGDGEHRFYKTEAYQMMDKMLNW